jgi:hypothetical protein
MLNADSIHQHILGLEDRVSELEEMVQAEQERADVAERELEKMRGTLRRMVEGSGS